MSNLPELPRTTSGKVDRKALPPFDPTRPDIDIPFEPPADEVETRLRDVWCFVLGLKLIGVNDDYHDLGGDSTLSARLFSEIKDSFDIDLPMATLFHAATVRTMAAAYGSRPVDIIAGIGPSIGPCCYEVGPEVIDQVEAVFGDYAHNLLHTNGGPRPYLDLWAANERLLEDSGLTRIEVSKICTASTTGEFFSHRAEDGHDRNREDRGARAPEAESQCGPDEQGER